jgi:hypothetical protein
MSDDIYFDGIKYISAKEASVLAGFTRDYIARLCRHGKVNARRLGALWYVDVVSLRELLSKRASATVNHHFIEPHRAEIYSHTRK